MAVIKGLLHIFVDNPRQYARLFDYGGSKQFLRELYRPIFVNMFTITVRFCVYNPYYVDVYKIPTLLEIATMYPTKYIISEYFLGKYITSVFLFHVFSKMWCLLLLRMLYYYFWYLTSEKSCVLIIQNYLKVSLNSHWC